MLVNSHIAMEEDQNNNGGGGCIKKERTAAEIRKSNKPLMERKRRERINNCLQQLKSILMEVTKKESSYYSKLEKADILEMTVKYLKNVKRQQLSAPMTSDPTILGKYVAGYNECTTEITKCLSSIDGLTPDVRTRLLNHLANSLQRNSVSMAASTAVNNIQMPMTQTCGLAQPLGIQIPAATQLSTLPGSNLCVLNQQAQGIQAISASAMQLVPAKLPSGDIVFLLANHQTVSPQGSGVSVSTVQNNVNNININPTSQAQGFSNVMQITDSGIGGLTASNSVNSLAHGQFSFPTNISTVSPLLVSSKGLQSPNVSIVTSSASTSDTSPESDISEASSRYSDRSHCSFRSHLETPVRRRDEVPRKVSFSSPASDSSSDSDNNEDDEANNNDHAREESVIRGPMWRPW